MAEALVMLRKSQDGDTDEFIIFRVRFCVTTVSNIVIIVKWCSGIACDGAASLGAVV